MKKLAGAMLVAAFVAACTENKPAAPPHRVEVKRLTGSTMEVIPTEGQMPYCLVFTISDTGTVRQLTMNGQNKSVKCEAGQPIGNHAYRVPVGEGAVRVHVFFSDRKLEAGSVAQQIYELASTNPKFTVLDLRLPGDVRSESLEFQPQPEEAVATGEVIGKGGVAADAGTAAMGADAGK